jgi:hypothetical protein
MLKVKKALPIDSYCLEIELSNGEVGVFDVKPYLDKGIFTELKNVEYFKNVRVLFNGIAWPNGQDFSADTIAFELKELSINN